MRIDLFLKVVGLAKTRMIAKRLCEIEKILVNGRPVKPSHEILGGEALELSLPAKNLSVKVLAVPSGRSVSKKQRPEYIEWTEGENPERGTLPEKT